jgi:hypothetical protein
MRKLEMLYIERLIEEKVNELLKPLSSSSQRKIRKMIDTAAYPIIVQLDLIDLLPEGNVITNADEFSDIDFNTGLAISKSNGKEVTISLDSDGKSLLVMPKKAPKLRVVEEVSDEIPTFPEDDTNDEEPTPVEEEPIITKRIKEEAEKKEIHIKDPDTIRKQQQLGEKFMKEAIKDVRKTYGINLDTFMNLNDPGPIRRGK